MKKLLFVLFTAALMLLVSCNPSGSPSGEFRLLPSPDSLEFYGNSKLQATDLNLYRLADGLKPPLPDDYLSEWEEINTLSEPQVIFRKDVHQTMGDEEYILEVGRDQVTITAAKKAGFLYGWMTLQQLLTDSEEQGVPLPLCYIQDSPKLSYRAIHLDVKHHLEKKEYYYALMDYLASYKINAIIAEVEDKLAYERQPLVGSEDAMSIEDWKDLSDYAMERNIEISPLVQGLGHASFILKHEEYRDLRDNPDSDWAFNPLDPRTYEVQFDLYLDAMEAFPDGRYLHVGGDEVHTTGRGSGKSELELQLTWLNKVCEFADEHDRIPIFWDDMPLKYAGLYDPMFNTKYTREEIDNMWAENEYKLVESLDMFPKKCIYMRWNYSHPESEGNIKAMEWFSEQDLPVMGATAGQTRWVLMPQNESNMDNIRSFALTSIEKEIDGLLLTLWDDDSPHFELYKRGILAFAEYSWAGESRSKEDIKTAYRQREYAYSLAGEEFGFVDQLEEMAGWWNSALLKSRVRNNLRAMEDPLEDGVIELPFSGEKGLWTEANISRLEAAESVLKDSKEIAATINTMKSETRRNKYRLEVYEQVNNLVQFSAQALLALKAYDSAGEKQEEEQAVEALQLLYADFSALRTQMENTYGKTRILTKPEGYILDQDHHRHLANQSIAFDWQFGAEMAFLEKLHQHVLPY
jgi:hypothetical protein